MDNGAVFQPHTDDYEGLVVSIQAGVEGEKVMRAKLSTGWEEDAVHTGDITLFAGDSFGKHSRTLHGFSFSGAYALAFTLGQDPWYTISGRLPMVEVNPDYNLPTVRPSF